MSHTIKQFCDKIDSVKKMADKLRNTPPSDKHIKNQIEIIQSDCLLLAKGKVDKEFFTNINDYESHTKNKKQVNVLVLFSFKPSKINANFMLDNKQIA